METRYEDGESVADAMEAGTDAIDDSSDGVEAQQMSPSQTVLDHQLNTKGREQDQTCHRSTSIKTQSNLIRLDPAVPNRNVAIIKIESDRMSSHVSIKHQHNVGSMTSDGIKPHHSHLTPDGCSFNKLIILNKPHLSLSNKSSVNQQNSIINQNQSLDGHKRNSRSHSVKIPCNEDFVGCKTRGSKKVKLLSNQPVAKISRNKTKTNVNLISDQYFPIQGSQLKSNDNDNTNNIVRRSKSVVIQCQSNNEKIFYQPFPHPAIVTIGDKPPGDSDNIKENLDDIKIEIEKLIFEREEIMRENSLLKFYKGAYGHLQSENQYLKNKLLKISTNFKSSEEKDYFDTTSEDDNSHDSRTMNNSLTSLDMKGKYSRLSPNTTEMNKNYFKH